MLAAQSELRRRRKKDTEHDLRRALNEELGQIMIQVPVGRRKPDFAAVVV